MEKNKQFTLCNIIGKKIYRYIDSNGQSGRIHFSRSPLTPVKCNTVSNGSTFIVLDGNSVKINNMQEIDAINNALNNFNKSLKWILSIPSEVIAKTNPELYLKVLSAIREAVTNSDYIPNKKFTSKKQYLSSERYEILSLITKKEIRIQEEVVKLKSQATNKNKVQSNAENKTAPTQEKF